MRTIEENLARIEALKYIVQAFYQVHYCGPWHMVIGTAWDWSVIHYNGETPAALADKVARDLKSRGEAKPHTPAQRSAESRRERAAAGIKRERVKLPKAEASKRVKLTPRKRFFT